MAGFSQENQIAESTLVEFPRSMLDAASSAQIRFRVDTEVGVTADGWHVDDIRVEAVSLALIFADGYESGDTSSWSQATP